MDIGRQQLQITEYVRPSDARVNAQAEALLPGYFIVAIGRYFSQSSTAISPRKATNRQGHAVHNAVGRVVVALSEQLSPELHFHRPQVR